VYGHEGSIDAACSRDALTTNPTSSDHAAALTNAISAAPVLHAPTLIDTKTLLGTASYGNDFTPVSLSMHAGLVANPQSCLSRKEDSLMTRNLPLAIGLTFAVLLLSAAMVANLTESSMVGERGAWVAKH
jgi:hypothetical protein